MGVKELWSILTPVCERKSLWDIQNKTIAVDLSGWVCDSQNVCDPNIQPRFYLRNLFFRTNCLLFIGVKPIFVLDGTAPSLKLTTMSKRKEKMGFSQKVNKEDERKELRLLKRPRLKAILKQCEELLKIMGVSCISSFGEAEALCAKLDQLGLVNGCISQDGDCFLYGAETVYRNFSISSSSDGASGFSIDIYTMDNIRRKLGLSRSKMVALSLLCGSDYSEGVYGIGKESALKFLNTLPDEEIITRLKNWRNNDYLNELEREKLLFKNGGCEECGHPGKHMKKGCNICGLKQGCIRDTNLKLPTMNQEQRKIIINELNIRSKALEDPNFPSKEIIDEYLNNELENEENFQLNFNWKQPQIINFMKFADKWLNWTESYSIEKIFPLLARWQVINKNISNDNCLFTPIHIIKKRILKGIPSYEVQWNDNQGLLSCIELEKHLSHSPRDNEKEEIKSKSVSELLITIEPQDIFEEAFPEIVKEFLQSKKELAEAKKESKKNKRKRKNNEDKPNSNEEILDLSDLMNKLDIKQKKKTTYNSKKNIKKSGSQLTLKSIFQNMKSKENSKKEIATTSCSVDYESFEWSSNEESEFSDMSFIIEEIVSRKEEPVNIDKSQNENVFDLKNNECESNKLKALEIKNPLPERNEILNPNQSDSEEENDVYVPLIERLKKNQKICL